ncbi:NADH-quinone oxidoreductase subunit C [Paenibacillus sp. 1001270B_150601_E10]|uniref:NADH-quinone oxidoreductase subunit C n=1 Tax=Paenibacillus sp. 1001270B_150601_E10 TaxID=2787079 RepID=UPI00189EF899|nr:NADH-quinone oxidoreductase subunit C [Paenibacillus sp. 1001270B_150601_E10]
MSEEEKQNATKHSHLSKKKSELPASQEQEDQGTGKVDAAEQDLKTSGNEINHELEQSEQRKKDHKEDKGHKDRIDVGDQNNQKNRLEKNAKNVQDDSNAAPSNQSVDSSAPSSDQESKAITSTNAPDTQASDSSASAAQQDPQHEEQSPPKSSTGDEKEKAEKAPAKERPARTPRNAKTEEKEPEEPSPNQPLFEQLLEDLKHDISEQAVQTSSINRKNGHLLTLTIEPEHWLATANWFKEHPQWQCNYLRNLSGVDQESYLEVVYHLIGLTTKSEVAIHVKAEREAPSIPSVTPIWATANWNEREVYDLLGIHFTGHPNLSRIMMPDQWVGHPLRKDYEPIDSEV